MIRNAGVGFSEHAALLDDAKDASAAEQIQGFNLDGALQDQSELGDGLSGMEDDLAFFKGFYPAVQLLQETGQLLFFIPAKQRGLRQKSVIHKIFHPCFLKKVAMATYFLKRL